MDEIVKSVEDCEYISMNCKRLRGSGEGSFQEVDHDELDFDDTPYKARRKTEVIIKQDDNNSNLDDSYDDDASFNDLFNRNFFSRLFYILIVIS